MNRRNTNPGLRCVGVPGMVLLLLILAACGESPSKGEQSKTTRYGKINISRFVYRDINRNGIYDLGDRPYAGQGFLLENPDGEKLYGRSNISGFANFKMSRDNPQHPVHSAGKYRLTALSQTGMVITSDNPEQTLDIVTLEGSPAGLVAAHTLEPLGVAPELTIRGRIREAEDAEPKSNQYKLTAIDDNGIRLPVEPDSAGYYAVPVHRGNWILQLDQGNHTESRAIVVEDNPVVVAQWPARTGNPASDSPGPENTRLINFDGLTTSDTLFEIPNGYGGLQWHNWIATHHKFYNGAGYINNTLSGEFIAYNSSGHPASIASDEPFDLVRFSLGVAWSKAEKGKVTVTAWRDQDLAYQDEFRAFTAHPVIIAADYRDITRVEFATSQYWQIVIDDLQYRK